MKDDSGKKIPKHLEVPDDEYLQIYYMVDELAGGDMTKYDYIENNKDVDDFALWMSFQSRKNSIEKWMIDGGKEEKGWEDLKNSYGKRK